VSEDEVMCCGRK